MNLIFKKWFWITVKKRQMLERQQQKTAYNEDLGLYCFTLNKQRKKDVISHAIFRVAKTDFLVPR